MKSMSDLYDLKEEKDEDVFDSLSEMLDDWLVSDSLSSSSVVVCARVFVASATVNDENELAVDDISDLSCC